MRRAIAAVLCANLLLTACASGGGPGLHTPQPQAPARSDPGLMADYVKRLAIGARVRASLVDGRKVKGTLMKADDSRVVIQERTRIPEPPVDVPLDRIATLELDESNASGRTIGIGIAAGAGGALSVFLILAAIFAASD